MKKLVFILFCLVLNVSSFFAQENFSVYFDSNKFELNTTQTQSLEQWITSNTTGKILAIHGFTDEDGTSGYNDTLAQKRVACIYNKIQNRIKIRDDFKTRSFGENFALSANKAQNRKVTIYYLLEKDLPREDEILGIKPKEPVSELREVIHYPEQMQFTNPDGSVNEYKLDVAFMKKLGEAQTGEKLKIDNLNFVINTYIVVPESRSKMYELLLVLQKNPSMKVQIQGHLCCMPVDRNDLSTQRAKAIKNFLVGQGINPERLTYKGFGSSQPIHPIPEKDETQRAANRRVEIEITAR
ncbi:OmpA family protein [Flavobacterium sp. CYK-55]|uniref:OmpA family protein n=1 Tax=Flavobacterium sp. CYK-55 TaxID=2835529 RepID=UPI001BCC1C4E|nr:OmpA family protein [Flavobacterium sp. CYK-55]MBS7786912.1 OmpA family protein [Flavobacterium sp. CYK-55]